MNRRERNLRRIVRGAYAPRESVDLVALRADGMRCRRGAYVTLGLESGPAHFRVVWSRADGLHGLVRV